MKLRRRLSTQAVLPLFTLLVASCGAEEDGESQVEGDALVESAVQGLGPSPDTDCTYYEEAGRDYWFCTTPRQWQAARTRCQSVGLDLASIETSAENLFIASHLLLGTWIGATDTAVEGQWRWVAGNVQFWQGGANGSAVGGSYASWGPGDPNNFLDEDCAATSGTGLWADEFCSNYHSYVCEGVIDRCPSDPNKVFPGQCGCGVPDTDSDGDGTADCNDACASDPNKVDAGQCGCFNADTDSDGDGIADCNDRCADDVSKVLPGACGCGVPDTDDDNDGVPSCQDECPNDPRKVRAGDCGCADDPKPLGVVCGDGLCSANSTCDGAGLCGDPDSCGTPDTQCDHAFFGNKNYWLCRTKRNFADARQRCENLGMKLARIDSAAEDSFLAAQMTWADDHVFIGATDSVVEGEFTWIDNNEKFWTGGTFGHAVNGSYSNFLGNAPTGDTIFSNNDCVVMDPLVSAGHWQVVSCSAAHSFVCEESDACGGCAPSTDPCFVRFCDAETGQCLTAPNDGVACDDGDPGTTDEICVAGECQASTSADPDEICGNTMAQYGEDLRLDPDFANNRRAIEKGIASQIYQASLDPINTTRDGVIQIPVVVHVVGEQAMQNVVPDSQITAALEQLNKDFRGLGGEVPQPFKKLDADMQVEFVLAKRSPSCASTETGSGLPAVIRVVNPAGSTWCAGSAGSEDCSGYDIDAIKKSVATAGYPSSQRGSPPWDTSRYLNIWVGHLRGSLAGRATFPGGNASVDGVIVHFPFFGPRPSTPGHTLGRTLTHEVGHYFDLRHTFQQSPGATCSGSAPAGNASDGCDLFGDLVCDTPPMHGESTTGCPAVGTVNSCSEVPDQPDMTMNYMDYTDDACRSLFTHGQKARLNATLNGARAGLKRSTGLIPPPPSGIFDLWVSDGQDDIGEQPNYQSTKFWVSDDIWVRRKDDGNTTQIHENPAYLGPGQNHNYVYVNVRNRGCDDSVPTYVNLFWAKASTALSWPAPWDGSESIMGPGGTPVLMGGPVNNNAGRNFVRVPALKSGGFSVAKFDWYTPNPADYASIGGEAGHFCLLALVDPCAAGNFDANHELINPNGACADSDNDGWPGTFTLSTEEGPVSNPLLPNELSTNVQWNNNMAWKNVTVTTTGSADVSSSSVLVGGTPDGADARFVFVEPTIPTRRDSVFAWGTVVVDLGATLYTRWQQAGAHGSYVQALGNNEVRLLASNAVLDDIPMAPGDRIGVKIRFEPDSASASMDRRTAPDVYVMSMQQYAKRTGGDKLVGGNDFVLKTFRPVPPVIIE